MDTTKTTGNAAGGATGLSPVGVLSVVRKVLFEYLPASLMVAIVVILCADVFGRYVLNSPNVWASEASLFCFIWLVYLGAVGVAIRRSHIAVDIVTSRLADRPKAVLAVFTQLLTIVILGYLAWFGLRYFFDGRFTSLPSLGVSKRFLELAIPISAAGMLAVAVADLVAAVRGVVTGQYTEHVNQDELVEEDAQAQSGDVTSLARPK